MLLGTALAALPAVSATAVPHNAALVAGDRAWEERASHLSGRLADRAGIAATLDHYRRALRDDPTSPEARWKLLRALHYLIDFSNADSAEKQRAAGEAADLAAFSLTASAAAPGSDRDLAQVHFWSAIAWGVRAKRVGLLKVVREGLANEMRAAAERALALDPEVERGGPLRLLSRLHAELPRVPWVSGWVDRELALPYAERAHRAHPDHPGNRLILAVTLLERAPERRAEAIALLESVAAQSPNPDAVAEELAIRHQARERLATMAGAEG